MVGWLVVPPWDVFARWEDLEVPAFRWVAWSCAEGVDVALAFGFDVWPLTFGAVVPLTLGTTAALRVLGLGSSPRVKVRSAAAATVSVTALAIAVGIGFGT